METGLNFEIDLLGIRNLINMFLMFASKALQCPGRSGSLPEI